MLVTIESQISEKDYIDIVMHDKRKKLGILLIIQVLLAIYTFATLSNTGEEATASEIFAKTLMPFAILFTLFLFYMLRVKAKKQFKSNIAFHSLIKYFFSKNNIKVEGENFNSSIHWNTVHKLKELKNCYLIYYSTTTFLIVLKSAFTPEKESQFRNLVTSVDNLGKGLV